MKIYILLFASLSLYACAVSAKVSSADTVGTDGSLHPSDMNTVVNTMRNNAFLSNVNRSWAAGPTVENEEGYILNTLNIGALVDISLVNGGRNITATKYDMVSFPFKFQAAESASKAYYTNETVYTNARVGILRTVAYSGIKIDTPKGESLPSLIQCGYKTVPRSADFDTIVDQKTFDEFRDKFWSKEQVDFDQSHAYLGDTGLYDSGFLSAVNKVWAKGENASIGTEGLVTNIAVREGGRLIDVAFSGGNSYSFTFDSSSSNTTEAFYRHTYKIKSLYTVTRTIGISVEGNELNWYGYDHSAVSGEPYEVQLAAVNSQESANTLNRKFHARELVSFTAANKHANLGQP